MRPDRVNASFLSALQERGEAVAWQMNAQDVADCVCVVCALEPSGRAHAGFLDALLRQARDAAPEMTAAQVAACMSAAGARLAGRGGADRPALLALAEALQRRGAAVCGGMHAGEVAGCLGCVGRLEAPRVSLPFVRALQRCGAGLAPRMSAAQVAACLDGISRLHAGDTDADFLAALQAALRAPGRDLVRGMRGPQVAAALHACLYGPQRAAAADRGVVRALQERGALVAREMAAEDVAKAMYALQWLEPAATRVDFVVQLYARGARVAGEMRAEDVAHCLFAASRYEACEAPAAAFIGALQSRCLHRSCAPGMDAPTVARTLRALSHLRRAGVRGDVIDALQLRGAALVGQMHTQELVLTLAALADLRGALPCGDPAAPGSLARAVAARVAGCAPGMSEVELQMVARAAALLTESGHLDDAEDAGALAAIRLALEERSFRRPEAGPERPSYRQLFDRA